MTTYRAWQGQPTLGTAIRTCCCGASTLSIFLAARDRYAQCYVGIKNAKVKQCEGKLELVHKIIPVSVACCPPSHRRTPALPAVSASSSCCSTAWTTMGKIGGGSYCSACQLTFATLRSCKNHADVNTAAGQRDGTTREHDSKTT